MFFDPEIRNLKFRTWNKKLLNYTQLVGLGIPAILVAFFSGAPGNI
jgi:hypothetical protein